MNPDINIKISVNDLDRIKKVFEHLKINFQVGDDLENLDELSLSSDSEEDSGGKSNFVETPKDNVGIVED